MMKVNKEDIARELKRELGSLLAAKGFVDNFFAAITDALAAGEPVKLTGLGVFRRLEKRPRIGRNPRTGVSAAIAGRRVAAFSAGGKLRRQVAQADE